MTKAVWNGQVLAESENTIRIEGNHYFPPASVKMDFLAPNQTHTICYWKGEASYYNVVVDDAVNEDAAWYYPVPMEGSVGRVGEDFTHYVAFWHGVEVA